jgi:voltage-gated potassium channel
VIRFLVGLLASAIRTPRQRRNFRVLAWLGLAFVGLLVLFSVGFHWIMAREGQQHSWVTSVYWTFVTMSTLGFGDITFASDLGRAFTIVVLLSGTVFLLVLLPFTFIQFFFLPWMEAREAEMVPRSLPPETSGHVVLTRLGAVEESLIPMLEAAGTPSVILIGDATEAGPLLDDGHRVMVGALDDPQTYRLARIDQAALVVTTRSDTANTNVAFTVRETCEQVPIVATASADASVDILQLAGCSRVLQLGRMLGEALARRVLGRDGRARVVGQFDDLLIAEAAIAGTDLAGRSIAEAGLREQAGVNAVGVWHRGTFCPATAETRLEPSTSLVLAGTRSQLDRYDERFGRHDAAAGLTIVIGGGRVGRAVAAALSTEGLEHRLIEKDASRLRTSPHGVHGDAADLAVLKQAGIADCSAVVITTHDDDVNVYLTLYCRRLRPDVQILARSTHERNVSTLHRAGADFVMSYATSGATAIYNLLKRVDVLLVTEGLHVFRLETPRSLCGRCLAETDIRQTTGCTVIAIGLDDRFDCDPDAFRPLPPGSELVLIGDVDAESRFVERYLSASPKLKHRPHGPGAIGFGGSPSGH